MRKKLQLLGFCIFSLSFLLACEDQNPTTTAKLVAKAGKWNMSANEKEEYSKYSTRDARVMFIRDKYQETAQSFETDAERRMLAAALFINFEMLQARAIPAYCAEMNIDLSSYQKIFAKAHAREKRAIDEILAAEGTTADEIWENYRSRMRVTAKYELMSTGSSSSACHRVVEEPQKFVSLIKFSSFFPKIGFALKNAA